MTADELLLKLLTIEEPWASEAINVVKTLMEENGQVYKIDIKTAEDMTVPSFPDKDQHGWEICPITEYQGFKVGGDVYDAWGDYAGVVKYFIITPNGSVGIRYEDSGWDNLDDVTTDGLILKEETYYDYGYDP